jgi:hypothetical protein
MKVKVLNRVRCHCHVEAVLAVERLLTRLAVLSSGTRYARPYQFRYGLSQVRDRDSGLQRECAHLR